VAAGSKRTEGNVGRFGANRAWCGVRLGDIFFPALALMLVLEGILPFLAPAAWREAFARMIQFSDGQLRFMGLISMLGGLLLLFLTR
jgi:uncharacterized protein YjeT (DUF2065 family)